MFAAMEKLSKFIMYVLVFLILKPVDTGTFQECKITAMCPIKKGDQFIGVHQPLENMSFRIQIIRKRNNVFAIFPDSDCSKRSHTLHFF